MRIGLCEDDDNDAERLLGYINGFEGVSALDRYVTSEQLLDAYGNGLRYDLLFMDIQLLGMNGFDAAKKIHSDYYGERPLIVFITVTDKYVYEAYNVGWDYACKPVDIDRIK